MKIFSLLKKKKKVVANDTPPLPKDIIWLEKEVDWHVDWHEEGHPSCKERYKIMIAEDLNGGESEQEILSYKKYLLGY